MSHFVVFCVSMTLFSGAHLDEHAFEQLNTEEKSIILYQR